MGTRHRFSVRLPRHVRVPIGFRPFAKRYIHFPPRACQPVVDLDHFSFLVRSSIRPVSVPYRFVGTTSLSTISILLPPSFTGRATIFTRSPSCYRVTYIVGYLPQELLGTSMYEYFHQDDISRLVDVHKAALKECKPKNTEVNFSPKPIRETCVCVCVCVCILLLFFRLDLQVPCQRQDVRTFTERMEKFPESLDQRHRVYRGQQHFDQVLSTTVYCRC